jgi:Ni/Fe-hydrogenase 1 B-type cytochrome subunit
MVSTSHPAPRKHRVREDPVVPAAFVYGWAIRLWHWVSAALIFALCVSGYMIAHPPPATGGEASASFYFGYVRFIHFTAGWLLAVGMVARLYLAWAQRGHTLEIFYVPFWNKAYLVDLWEEIKWYGFLRKRPKKYIGHNPLAQFAMFTGFTFMCFTLIFTGFALFAEQVGINSWYYFFFGWVFDLFGTSQLVRSMHNLSFWGMMVFVVTHVYAVFREDITSRQTIITSMVNGWRYFKDGDP